MDAAHQQYWGHCLPPRGWRCSTITAASVTNCSSSGEQRNTAQGTHSCPPRSLGHAKLLPYIITTQTHSLSPQITWPLQWQVGLLEPEWQKPGSLLCSRRPLTPLPASSLLLPPALPLTASCFLLPEPDCADSPALTTLCSSVCQIEQNLFTTHTTSPSKIQSIS